MMCFYFFLWGAYTLCVCVHPSFSHHTSQGGKGTAAALGMTAVWCCRDKRLLGVVLSQTSSFLCICWKLAEFRFFSGGIYRPPVEVQCTRIYYIPFASVPSRPLLHLTSPLDPFGMDWLVLQQRPTAHGFGNCPGLQGLCWTPCPAPGSFRTVWSHLTSKSELFALSKQQWMNLGLSLFTFWRIRPGSGASANIPTQQLPSCSRSVV